MRTIWVNWIPEWNISSNLFINVAAQIGTDMMGSTAIFHNDQNTQVGTQYGSESDFNNQQGCKYLLN